MKTLDALHTNNFKYRDNLKLQLAFITCFFAVDPSFRSMMEVLQVSIVRYLPIVRDHLEITTGLTKVVSN